MDYQKSFGEGTMLADDRGQSNKRPAVVNLRKGGGSPHLSLIRHATPCERKMISGPRMGNNRSRFFFFELNAVNWISFQDGIGETTLLKNSFRVLYRMEYWFVHTNLSRDEEDARRFRVTIIIFTSPIWESYFTFVLSSHVVVHSF